MAVPRAPPGLYDPRVRLKSGLFVPISAGMLVATAISREKILTTARSLPAAPQAMAGLCELLQDVNVDIGQIAEQISVDPALAARVVRLSNSVAFGGGGNVGSVDEAVNRVGFSEILRLVGAATVTTMVDRNLAGYGVAAERLRESLLMHAIASETLARCTAMDPRTAYTAGLLRAIGMMVIARIGFTARHVEGVYDSMRYGSYADWEGECFGIAGTEVTAIILREWRLPTEVINAIREHVHLNPVGYQNSFACLLNLAGAIVADAGMALAGEVNCWALTPEKLAAAGIDEDQWQGARTQARASFDRVAVALN